MKRLFLLIALFVFLLACKTTSININNGVTAYEQKKFVLAATLLQKEIANENDAAKKMVKYLLLANTYAEMNLPQNLVDTYLSIIELDKNPQYYLELAQAQKRNEAYSDALKTLVLYKSLTNDAFNSNPEIKLCQDIIAAQASTPNYSLQNLESINTPAAQYAPRLFKNNALVFTSTKSSSTGDKKQDWDGEKNPDIFIANYNNAQWVNTQSFDPLINTDLAEGVITFSKNFEEAYFTRCNYTEIGNAYCSIYKAEADGNLWYEPILFPIFSIML